MLQCKLFLTGSTLELVNDLLMFAEFVESPKVFVAHRADKTVPDVGHRVFNSKLSQHFVIFDTVLLQAILRYKCLGAAVAGKVVSSLLVFL